MEHQGRPVVTIKEACVLVGVSKRTLYNWLEHSKVEWVRTAGGQRRIVVDSLHRRQDADPGSAGRASA